MTITEMKFPQDPDALVAVTHDNEWITLIETVRHHNLAYTSFFTCRLGKTHARGADARGPPRRIIIGKLLTGLAT